ncbi:hypothetical protein ACOSQ4_005067 [Xanthoceras sorbifolium]
MFCWKILIKETKRKINRVISRLFKSKATYESLQERKKWIKKKVDRENRKAVECFRAGKQKSGIKYLKRVTMREQEIEELVKWQSSLLLQPRKQIYGPKGTGDHWTAGLIHHQMGYWQKNQLWKD